jgi:hypothetical protein
MGGGGGGAERNGEGGACGLWGAGRARAKRHGRPPAFRSDARLPRSAPPRRASDAVRKQLAPRAASASPPPPRARAGAQRQASRAARSWRGRERNTLRFSRARQRRNEGAPAAGARQGWSPCGLWGAPRPTRGALRTTHDAPWLWHRPRRPRAAGWRRARARQQRTSPLHHGCALRRGAGRGRGTAAARPRAALACCTPSRAPWGRGAGPRAAPLSPTPPNARRPLARARPRHAAPSAARGRRGRAARAAGDGGHGGAGAPRGAAGPAGGRRRQRRRQQQRRGRHPRHNQQQHRRRRQLGCAARPQQERRRRRRPGLPAVR